MLLPLQLTPTILYVVELQDERDEWRRMSGQVGALGFKALSERLTDGTLSKEKKTIRKHGRSQKGESSEIADYQEKTLNHSTTILISRKVTREINWDFAMKCSRRNYRLCTEYGPLRL